jgi:hypothetical protein
MIPWGFLRCNRRGIFLVMVKNYLIRFSLAVAIPDDGRRPDTVNTDELQARRGQEADDQLREQPAEAQHRGDRDDG